MLVVLCAYVLCSGFCAADTTMGPLSVPSGEGLPITAAEWAEFGDMLAELRRDAEANQAYEYALLLDPTDAKTWSKHGQILVKEYKYEEAQEAYRRALALNPDDARTWNNFGSLLFQMGSLAEAVTAFEQAISLDPGYIPDNSPEDPEPAQQIQETETVEKNSGFPFIFFVNNVLIGCGIVIIVLLSRLKHSPSSDPGDED